MRINAHEEALLVVVFQYLHWIGLDTCVPISERALLRLLDIVIPRWKGTPHTLYPTHGADSSFRADSFHRLIEYGTVPHGREQRRVDVISSEHPALTLSGYALPSSPIRGVTATYR